MSVTEKTMKYKIISERRDEIALIIEKEKDSDKLSSLMQIREKCDSLLEDLRHER